MKIYLESTSHILEWEMLGTNGMIDRIEPKNDLSLSSDRAWDVREIETTNRYEALYIRTLFGDSIPFANNPIITHQCWFGDIAKTIIFTLTELFGSPNHLSSN